MLPRSIATRVAPFDGQCDDSYLVKIRPGVEDNPKDTALRHIVPPGFEGRASVACVATSRAPNWLSRCRLLHIVAAYRVAVSYCVKRPQPPYPLRRPRIV